jgi:methionine synthase II (cobalamin-independent)
VFATLLGGLPRPTTAPGELRDFIEAVVRAQEDAGLEPITDGRLHDPGFDLLAAALAGSRGGASPQSAPSAVDGWRVAAGLTERAVKQALPGPYSLGWRPPGGSGRASERAQLLMGSAKRDRRERAARTMAYADALRREIDALAGAGCPLVEIEETEAHRIGTNEGERALFRDAHQRLVEGVTGTHLSLSIVGGSAADAGIETILAAPYASLAVDLVAGPDNWRLVVDVPGDRGVVAGAMTTDEATDQPRELVLWAAHYAASTGGRGIARVGLGSAGSFANLTWAAAVRKMRALGEAARLAALPPSEELMRSLLPAAISARRAALGPDAPPRPRPRRRC